MKYCRNCPLEGDCVKIVPCDETSFVMMARCLASMPRVTRVAIRRALMQNYAMTEHQIRVILRRAEVDEIIKKRGEE